MTDVPLQLKKSGEKSGSNAGDLQVLFMEEKIELTWYEKRRGIKLRDKIKAEQRRKQFLEKQSRQKEMQAQKAPDRNASVPRKSSPAAQKKHVHQSLFSVDSIPDDAKKIISRFDEIIDSTHPLNSKQKALLPKQIRGLSHYLTDSRSDRRLGYMNQTTLLSAYVRYYSWWNLVRLTRLFSNIGRQFFSLEDGSVCLDIGSGPLTVPIALFLARPELRKKSITFYCIDRSQQAMAFGENLFLSAAAKLKCPGWKIIRIKGELGEPIKEKADLVVCANVFNELYDDADSPPDFLAKKYTDELLSYLDMNSSCAQCFIAEPGDPRSARLISLMRDCFMRRGFFPVSPCTHCAQCPMDGKKGGKWCNFAFKTDDAPSELKKLSEKAELPKERAVLSFLAVQKSDGESKKGGAQSILLRIASDPIKLPGGRTGYYACSEQGLILAVSSTALSSGELISARLPGRPLRIDAKSGAQILEL